MPRGWKNNMSKRRSKLEMYVEILDACARGNIKPTKIMYAINTSWKPLQQMFQALIDKELIEKNAAEEGDERSENVYSITDKGRNVLEYFNKMKILVEPKRQIEIMNWK
jgi:predicted transcriptional regulator